MSFTPDDHTFALCAYGESPWLEDCIRSLKAQTVKTNLLIATGTPNETISRLAEQYRIPVCTHEGGKGIGADWNAAFDVAGTKLVTLAHQDDLYEPRYANRMLEGLNRARDPILWLCGYGALRNGKTVYDNRNLNIKKLMLLPVKNRIGQKSRWVRRRILSLGSPICCPAATYIKEKTGPSPFSTEMKVSLDWDQWEKLSRKTGEFVYCPEPLMLHRVHEGSATTELIADETRAREDLEMFRRFWPEKIAAFLEKKYSRSEDSNSL